MHDVVCLRIIIAHHENMFSLISNATAAENIFSLISNAIAAWCCRYSRFIRRCFYRHANNRAITGRIPGTHRNTGHIVPQHATPQRAPPALTDYTPGCRGGAILCVRARQGRDAPKVPHGPGRDARGTRSYNARCVLHPAAQHTPEAVHATAAIYGPARCCKPRPRRTSP